MRYNNSKLLRDENGTRYLNRIEYPVIPIQDTDIFIRGKFGQRLDNLANTYYGKSDLWWIIARANNQNNGSMYLTPGKEYRIPQAVGLILQKFNQLNR
tara:strand:+ start:854 stop:1147 length:294 start_codon:yes stop_codon:yes gene_type:complete